MNRVKNLTTPLTTWLKAQIWWEYFAGIGFDGAEIFAVLLIAILRWVGIVAISSLITTMLQGVISPTSTSTQQPQSAALWEVVRSLIFVVGVLGAFIDLARITLQERTLPKLPEPEIGEETLSISQRLVNAKDNEKKDPDHLRTAAETAAKAFSKALTAARSARALADTAESALHDTTIKLQQAKTAFDNAEAKLKEADDKELETELQAKKAEDIASVAGSTPDPTTAKAAQDARMIASAAVRDKEAAYRRFEIAKTEYDRLVTSEQTARQTAIKPQTDAETAYQALKTARADSRQAEEAVNRLSEKVETLEKHIRIRKRQRAYYNRAALTLFLVSVVVGISGYLIGEAMAAPNRGVAIFASLVAFVVVSWWQIQSRPIAAPSDSGKEESSEIKKAENLARLFEETDEQKEALTKLFQHTVAKAQNNIDWYTRNARLKKRRAQIIRLLSLSMLGIGSVSPVMIDLYHEQNPSADIPTSIATLIIAAGTGLIALDRFWGYSTGWMRFLTTEMQIKTLLESFQYDWYTQINQFDVNETGLTEALITRCATLRDQINNMVQEETKSWVEEFQASLRTYDTSLKALSEGSQPGAISVKVECGEEYDQGWMVILDDKLKYKRQGKHAAIINVAPGQHRIAIQLSDSDVIQDERPVMVTSGQIIEVALELPSKKPAATATTS